MQIPKINNSIKAIKENLIKIKKTTKKQKKSNKIINRNTEKDNE